MKSNVPANCRDVFFVLWLSRFRDADLDVTVHNTDGIRGNIDNCRHLHGLPGANIKLAAMARTDDVIPFDVPIPKRSIVMRTNVTDRKELSCNVKDDDLLICNIHKQTLAVGKFS